MTTVRLRYIDRVKGRKGATEHFYFRKGKGPRVALPGRPGTPEFMAAYNRALAGAGIAPARVGRAPATPGSFDALLAFYYRSTEFKSLAVSTQKGYRRVFDRWVAEEKIGHRPVAGMTREHVSIMLGRRAATPAAANDLGKKIALLMSFAIDHKYRRDNPATRLKKFAVGSYHTWTDDEIAAFEARWPIGTRERLAFALLLYTGQRLSDVVRMTWRHIKDGAIRVRQQKTGAEIDVALHPELRAILKATKQEHVSLFVTGHNKAFKANGFGTWMAERIEEAGLPDRCVTHGLRKAAARRLAEAGCSALEIMAVTGHTTLSEVERYVREANQRRLSAQGIARLVGSRLPKRRAKSPNAPAND